MDGLDNTYLCINNLHASIYIGPIRLRKKWYHLTIQGVNIYMGGVKGIHLQTYWINIPIRLHP